MHLKTGSQLVEDAKSGAQTAKDAAQAALDNAKLKMITGTPPQAFDTTIDSVAPPNGPYAAAGARAKAMVHTLMATGDYEGAKAALSSLSNEIGGFEKEKYVQQQTSIRESLNRQAAQGTTLQAQALKSLDTMWTDPQHGFGEFLSQAQMTKQAVGDSKDGNELASNLIPVMTAQGISGFAGIKRIPPAEVAAAGPQLGSIYRQINGILDKAGTGSVPADTLKEVTGLVDQMIQVRHTQTVAQSVITANNAKAFGGPGLDTSKISVFDKDGSVVPLSSLQPAQAPTQNRGGPQAGGDVVKVQIPGQLPGTIPRSQLQQFKRKHPNALVIQ